MPELHVHVGHHFFGSGNLGDDLMLAGFLEAARPRWLRSAVLTCCTPHDTHCQRLRFPEINWLPYDEATRAACIARADVWLGLGDTPFQATGGHTWFLDHLGQEAAWCRQHGTPMYYLGVGVNERATADRPQVRALVEQAERVWTRDENSAAMLRPLAPPGKVTAHADLAHLALAGMRFPPPEPDSLGLVLNFEDPAQFRAEGLAALVRAAGGWRLRWLVQEVRPLPGAETTLHRLLPAGLRARAPLGMPDYARAASARALLAAWEGVQSLFVSRYHAALIGAWIGAGVAAFARNDKVAGAIRQLGLPEVASLDDPADILRTVEAVRPVERRVLLDLAGQVREVCEEFFAMSASVPPSPTSSRPHPPARLLFLRPDAYGDLCLFEPVLRIVRQAWPQTEIAVLIRESYQDIIPLLNSSGVRWLTTACNPYREGPGDHPAALDNLRETVRAFAPDCVVAACAEQTWLESAAAAFLPAARQISSGPGLTDPLTRAALGAVVPVDWDAIYPEKLPVDTASPQWEQNLGLAGALLGHDAPRWWPVVQVPASARAQAEGIVAGAGLSAGRYAVCAAAGTANVRIKSWPAESYGETLAWLAREQGVSALLIGHVSERDALEAVRQAARRHGVEPALWLGQDGEMPVVAGLLDAARCYFGNDTGALHLAAALGRPVVPIFGGGHGLRFAPVAARARTVVQPLPCFGCAWDCLYVDAPCVRTISTAAVRQALEEILGDSVEQNIVLEADGLDVGAREIIDRATAHLRFLRADGADRLRQVTELSLRAGELSARLQASDADRDARRQQVTELTDLVGSSESDRDARRQQVQELTALLKTSETDRDARQLQVQELTLLLAVSETDRDARQQQVEELATLLKTSEIDRDARQQQVEELTALVKTSDADRDARQKQVQELSALLAASEADRDARQSQVEELTPLLRASETDRDTRQEQVQELTTLLKTSEADRDARQIQVEELTSLLTTSEADRNARQDQVEELGSLLEASETDREARQGQIEQLTAMLQASDADREARQGQIEQLTAWLLTSEADRAARLQLIEELAARLDGSDADHGHHPEISPEPVDAIHGEADPEEEPSPAHVHDQADAAHF